MSELPKRALIKSKLIDNLLQNLTYTDLDTCYYELSNQHKKQILDSVVLSNGSEASSILKQCLVDHIKNDVEARLDRIRDDGFISFSDLSDIL